jgi:hypothetical protein
VRLERALTRVKAIHDNLSFLEARAAHVTLSKEATSYFSSLTPTVAKKAGGAAEPPKRPSLESMNSSARLPKQSVADAARATVKGTKADPGLKWRYSRSQVSDAVSRRRMIAAVCASVGGLSAMVQQERIVWGSDPRLPEIDLLKVCALSPQPRTPYPKPSTLNQNH